MTLAEMADYVCGKVNQTETNDVTACKGFLRRRYELMFNDQLWKDSLAAVDMTLDPDDADNAQGVVVLPPLIDRPIAVRGANRGILVNPLERYYRIDLDMFIRQGTQYEMALLSPAWFTVRPVDDPFAGTVITPAVTTYPAVPNNFITAVFTVIGEFYQWTPGVNETSLVANGGATVLTEAGVFEITVGASQIDVYGAEGTTYTGELKQVSGMNLHQSSGAGTTLTITSSDTSDASNIKVIWRDLAGKRYETTAALPTVTLTPDDDAGYFEIEAVFKSATTGDITFTLNDPSGVTQAQGTMLAADTRSPSFQRIRVFDIPNASADIKVAGKIKCDALDFDNQEPQLRGCENILMTFAQADMLERERQYGKAQAKVQEAVALLEQYKRIETVQQAHNMRLIPQEGFVTEYDLYSANLLTF